jgi:hypothetical protein
MPEKCCVARTVLPTYHRFTSNSDNSSNASPSGVPRNRHVSHSGWGTMPGTDTGPVFSCFVTGDPRLPEVAYPFVCRKLDCLLRGRSTGSANHLRLANARS